MELTKSLNIERAEREITENKNTIYCVIGNKILFSQDEKINDFFYKNLSILDKGSVFTGVGDAILIFFVYIRPTESSKMN